MKKITITNAYTWYNKGDAGILLGIVNALKKIYGEKNIEINILSFSPLEDKEKYCIDPTIKNVYSNILNPHPYKHTKIGKLNAIIKLIVKSINIKFCLKFFRTKIIKRNEVLNILDQSDIIVVCGGGFLGGKKLDSLMHLYQIDIDTKFNKPVIMMGTSIEPIKNIIVKKCTENVLKKVDFIYARESITYSYLKKFMPKEKIEIIPDMAFMLDDIKKKDNKFIEIRKKYNIVFGITVRKWNFPNSNKPSEHMNTYINSVKDMMISFCNRENCCFVFIPQVIVNYANDVDIAKKIKDILPEDIRDRFIILEDDYSPEEIKQLIWNCDYFIGTRMHSNIFATSMEIPTTAIAYEKKTNGIMETVGLEDYVVEIDSINSDLLIKMVNKLIKNDEDIIKNLKTNIPKIREEIMIKLSNTMKGLLT